MIELTITQMAARMGVSERTTHRYIHAGKLTLEPTSNRRYNVSESQLDTLSVTDLDALSELREQVAGLTKRVEELELARTPKKRAKTDTSLAESPARPASDTSVLWP